MMQYLPLAFHYIDFSLPGCLSQSQNAFKNQNDFTNYNQFKFEEIWKWMPKRKLTLNAGHVALITAMMQYLPLAFHYIDFSLPGCLSQSQNAFKNQNDFTNYNQFKFEEIWKWTPKRKLTLNAGYVALITVMMQYLQLAFHYIDFSLPGCLSQSQNAFKNQNDFTNYNQFKFEEIWKWMPKRKLTLNAGHVALITVMMQYFPLAFYVLYYLS